MSQDALRGFVRTVSERKGFPEVERGSLAVALAKGGLHGEGRLSIASLLESGSPLLRRDGLLALGLLGGDEDARILVDQIAASRERRQGESYEESIFAAWSLCLIPYGSLESPSAFLRDLREMILACSDEESPLATALVFAWARWVGEGEGSSVQFLWDQLNGEEGTPGLASALPTAIALALDSASPEERGLAAMRLHALFDTVPESSRLLRLGLLHGLGLLLSRCDEETAQQIGRSVLETRTNLLDRLHRGMAILAVGYSTWSIEDPEARTDFARDLARMAQDGGIGTKPWASLATGLAALPRGAAADNEEVWPSILPRKPEVNKSLQSANALGLGLIRDRSATRYLESRLEASRDPWDRSYLSLGLGLIGARDSRPLIDAALDHSCYRQFDGPAFVATGLLGSPAFPPAGSSWDPELARSLQLAFRLAPWQADDVGAVVPVDLERASFDECILALEVLGEMARPWWIPPEAILQRYVNYRALDSTLVCRQRRDGLLDLL